MPDPTEPATTVPALPKNAIPVPLVPAAGRPTGGRPTSLRPRGGGRTAGARTPDDRANRLAAGGEPAGDRSRANRRTGGRRPLPDAQAICSFTVPEIAPPYDDAAPVRLQTRGASRGGLASVTTRRGSARGDLPAGEPVPQPPRTRLSSAQPPRAQLPSAQPPRRQSPGNQPPGTGTWPSQFAQVLAETLAGSRPADQIAPWTTEQARRRISQLGPMLATAHRPRVRRVIVSSPASGVLEMTVIVGLGAHVRAVAVRLERAGARPPSEPSVRGDTRNTPPARPTASQRGQPTESAPVNRGGPTSPRQAGQPVRPRPDRYWRPDNRPYNRRPAGSSEWLCTAIEAA